MIIFPERWKQLPRKWVNEKKNILHLFLNIILFTFLNNESNYQNII